MQFSSTAYVRTPPATASTTSGLWFSACRSQKRNAQGVPTGKLSKSTSVPEGEVAWLLTNRPIFPEPHSGFPPPATCDRWRTGQDAKPATPRLRPAKIRLYLRVRRSYFAPAPPLPLRLLREANSARVGALIRGAFMINISCAFAIRRSGGCRLRTTFASPISFTPEHDVCKSGPNVSNRSSETHPPNEWFLLLRAGCFPLQRYHTRR